MEILAQYGLFLAQALTIVVAILLVAGGLMAIGQRQKSPREGRVEVRHLNERYRRFGNSIRDAVESQAQQKQRAKRQKKAEKAREKAARKAAKAGEEPSGSKPRLYVLSFDGDLKASATEQLREEISALLPQLREGDEVLLRLESPGGLVHGYGLAASQVQRIRDAGVTLTIAVDKVAASGGYMMACVAERIIAAPFAVIGSIGVIAQLPNFHRLLKKHDIDFELLTAGEYKRTLTLFGENTDKGREKFVEDLETTHGLFKDFVGRQRPSLDIDRVATGEIWYGQDAVGMGLVDAIQTSDAFIQERLEETDIYELRFVQRKHWQEKLGMATEDALERSVLKLWQRNRGPHV